MAITVPPLCSPVVTAAPDADLAKGARKSGRETVGLRNGERDQLFVADRQHFTQISLDLMKDARKCGRERDGVRKGERSTVYSGHVVFHSL